MALLLKAGFKVSISSRVSIQLGCVGVRVRVRVRMPGIYRIRLKVRVRVRVRCMSRGRLQGIYSVKSNVFLNLPCTINSLNHWECPLITVDGFDNMPLSKLGEILSKLESPGIRTADDRLISMTSMTKYFIISKSASLTNKTTTKT